ncbi:unnamed protein product [Lota lota]
MRCTRRGEVVGQEKQQRGPIWDWTQPPTHSAVSLLFSVERAAESICRTLTDPEPGRGRTRPNLVGGGVHGYRSGAKERSP